MGEWEGTEIEELKLHYKECDIPSDELLKDEEQLQKLTSYFNAKSTPDQGFSQKKMADQLLKLRKSGKLPRLRR